MRYSKELLDSTVVIVIPKRTAFYKLVDGSNYFENFYTKLDKIIKLDRDDYGIFDDEERGENEPVSLSYKDDYGDYVEVNIEDVIQIDKKIKKYFIDLIEPYSEPATLDDFMVENNKKIS